MTVGEIKYYGVQTQFKQDAMEKAAIVAHNALSYSSMFHQVNRRSGTVNIVIFTV